LAFALLAGCGSDEEDIELLTGGGYVCLLVGDAMECQSNGDSYDNGETSPPARRWESVTHANANLCGFTSDHAPYCWGWNESGQTDIPSGLSIDSFFLGYANTCAIDTAGALVCWGNEWTGLNDPPAGTFVQAAAAERVACARSEDGAWSCWGTWWGVDETEDGYLFDWTLPDEPLVEIEGQSGNICGLDEDGAIHCWGMSNWGVTEPPDGTGYRDLSVGTAHACAVASTNEVTCWGDVEVWQRYMEGQWRTFDAGSWMDCGIRDNGEIDCWGCLYSDPFACDWDE
jgi:hypothetical protein